MIRSMTGFARSETVHPLGQLTCELKTVNHRFLEMSFRLPEDFRVIEAQLRQAITASVRRGKVECNLQFRPTAQTLKLELDQNVLASVLQASQQIAAAAGAGARIDVIDVLRWPGVVRDSSKDMVNLMANAQALLERTLQELARFRDSEGGRLRTVMEQKTEGLLALAEQVEARLPEIRVRQRSKLHERIAQWAAEVNQERMEQELATVAQRLDVDEELERLRGHLIEVRKTFDGQEPAGRRLDFLMQELNREANTLSSKSQDIETTRAAVDMKVLIEQMREQVQNIE
jgi:uncharacterized protein (TIGR00255 family)